ISTVLRYFTDALKKRATTFLISDFIDSHDYSKALAVARNRHDVIAVQIYDKRDATLPDVGLMQVTDLETGAERWIDTSSKKTRQAYRKWWYDRQQLMMNDLRRARVDLASIATDEDYVSALMNLFRRRGTR
ncbi:MAG: DUF58 domain-containing protein, partial [Paramuribaculum sp.]|nr:DUF58 domain-containing protein [Paramuribaculum sp.]